MGEWVELGIASADDPFFHFVRMTCGAMGWVKDSSFPTLCMQFRYWRMVRYYIELSGILCWLKHEYKHLGFGIEVNYFYPKGQ
jgi:hypothetical protein